MNSLNDKPQWNGLNYTPYQSGAQNLTTPESASPNQSTHVINRSNPNPPGRDPTPIALDALTQYTSLSSLTKTSITPEKKELSPQEHELVKAKSAKKRDLKSQINRLQSGISDFSALAASNAEQKSFLQMQISQLKAVYKTSSPLTRDMPTPVIRSFTDPTKITYDVSLKDKTAELIARHEASIKALDKMGNYYKTELDKYKANLGSSQVQFAEVKQEIRELKGPSLKERIYNFFTLTTHNQDIERQGLYLKRPGLQKEISKLEAEVIQISVDSKVTDADRASKRAELAKKEVELAQLDQNLATYNDYLNYKDSSIVAQPAINDVSAFFARLRESFK